MFSAAALAIAPFMGMGAASAKPVGFNGSYVGAGVGAGVTSGGQGNDGATVGGNIQGRFAVPNAPVSVRGSVLFNGNSSAVIPSLSYDIPLNSNTNVYAGAGYSFAQKNGNTSQLGNQDAAVLQLGVESQVSRGIVLYSDVKYGINAYQGSNRGAVSLQGGVGFNF
jgi:hypothetical protein